MMIDNVSIQELTSQNKYAFQGERGLKIIKGIKTYLNSVGKVEDIL